jgi:hypothetical protein
MPQYLSGDDWKENKVASNLEPWIKFLGQDISQIGVLYSKG